MNEPQLDTIGERIRWIIEERLAITHRAFAERMKVKPAMLSRWVNNENTPSERYFSQIAEKGGVTEGWLRYGMPQEERPEDAVSETEVETEVRNALRVVRLVDGKDDMTPEQRRGLKRDILNTYIDAFKEDGFDTTQLYVALGQVDRGEL